MDVQYDEGVDSVQLEDGTLVKRGESVTVSAEIGQELCKQGWEQVNVPTTPPAAAKVVAPAAPTNTTPVITPKENN
jgi:hypothetical protein